MLDRKIRCCEVTCITWLLAVNRGAYGVGLGINSSLSYFFSSTFPASAFFVDLEFFARALDFDVSSLAFLAPFQGP
jgi:hypothetical protein